MEEFNVTPDQDGYELILNRVPLRGDSDNLHGRREPAKHITAIVEHSHGTIEGTILTFGSSIEQGTAGDEIRYNGFFAKIRSNDVGHVNLYADPGTGGPHVLPVRDWEGEGASSLKYPVESITFRLEDHDPVCRCGETMVFGYSESDENHIRAGDGSYGKWTAGWLCPECFPGRIRQTEQLP